MVKKVLPHIHSFLIKTLSKIFRNNGLLIKCIVEIHINRKLKVYKGKSITKEFLRLLPLRMINLGFILFIEYENIQPKKGEIIPNFPANWYNTDSFAFNVSGFDYGYGYGGRWDTKKTRFLQNNKLYVKNKVSIAIYYKLSGTILFLVKSSNLLPTYYCALINYMFLTKSYRITSLQDFILNAVIMPYNYSIPYYFVYYKDYSYNPPKLVASKDYYQRYLCRVVNEHLPIDKYNLTVDGMSGNKWYSLDITFTLIFEVV